MSAMASQITSFTIVCSTVCSGADQRKHQSSASLAFERGIHRWPVNSPHKGPVTGKMFPFDYVIILPNAHCQYPQSNPAVPGLIKILKSANNHITVIYDKKFSTVFHRIHKVVLALQKFKSTSKAQNIPQPSVVIKHYMHVIGSHWGDPVGKWQQSK